MCLDTYQKRERRKNDGGNDDLQESSILLLDTTSFRSETCAKKAAEKHKLDRSDCVPENHTAKHTW